MNSCKTMMFFVFLFLTTTLVPQKKFTVDEIYTNRSFSAKSVSGLKWHPGGEGFSFSKYDAQTKAMNVHYVDIAKQDTTLLIQGAGLKSTDGEQITLSNYEWSPAGTHLMITGVLPARSLKSGGTFYIYDVAKKAVTAEVASKEQQINMQFSPDGKKIAFSRGHNLFVYDLPSGTEQQLTFDGSDVVLNGVFDWVYEEEFSIIQAYAWSHDSRYLGYWRLDQTNVPEIKIQKWDSLYLNSIDMRYPKAGDRNSQVKIGIYDLKSNKNVFADLGTEEDIYVARMKFNPASGELWLQRLNRLQNRLDILAAHPGSGKTRMIYTETDEAWVDVHDNLFFPAISEKGFLWTSEKDGFNHIYHFSDQGKQITRLTSGKWEVADILGYDETTNMVYFTSKERGAMYSDLYMVRVDGSEKKRLTNEAGTHDISLSPTCAYYVDRYSSANTLTNTYLYSREGKKIKTLAESDMSVFSDYNLAKLEFITFNTSDGQDLNAYIIKPADFDAAKKYPVLIFTYGGPGSQVVNDRWGGANFLWHQMLAQKGYIIFAVDNRGTGGRGRVFKKQVYKDLGNFEVRDQVEAAKYLGAQQWVDAQRIGIWGWSYGGYNSALTLMKGADYFKAAISVAPVTHWKFYDTIYTERYMQTPQLNPEGYENSAVLAHTDKLKGKLLLVHGTGDDNVHFQNAVKLAEKLIAEDKPFETMYYPEKDHGIYGGKTRQHLFKMMTDFIVENL